MVYRDADEALRRRRDDLLAARLRELQAMPAEVPRVVARRHARRAAGWVGIAGAGLLAGCAIARAPALTAILQLTWLAVLATYVTVRIAAGRRLRRVLWRTFLPSDTPTADIDRFESLTPLRLVGEVAARVETWSVGVPMVALALLLPLSVHYLVVATVRVSVPRPSDFDGWISMSLLFVGHCHLVLASQAWRFAQSLRKTPDSASVGLVADRAGWRAWGITIAWSVVAGFIMLAVIPIAGIALLIVAPVLVGATGLTFIPAMFNRMGKTVRGERITLAE